MRNGPIPRAGWPIAMLAALTACNATDDSTRAERLELANTSRLAMVPKSSPNALLQGFEEHCLNTTPSPEAQAAKLRQAGYVPAGGWRDGNRDFVTGDQRPKIRITEDGQHCAAIARTSSGQDAAIQAALARWFPKASPLKATADRKIWLTGRRADEGIGILHNVAGPHQNEIMLALIQL